MPIPIPFHLAIHIDPLFLIDRPSSGETRKLITFLKLIRLIEGGGGKNITKSIVLFNAFFVSFEDYSMHTDKFIFMAVALIVY